jgi:hypothetical protein
MPSSNNRLPNSVCLPDLAPIATTAPLEGFGEEPVGRHIWRKGGGRLGPSLPEPRPETSPPRKPASLKTSPLRKPVLPNTQPQKKTETSIYPKTGHPHTAPSQPWARAHASWHPSPLVVLPSCSWIVLLRTIPGTASVHFSVPPQPISSTALSATFAGYCQLAFAAHRIALIFSTLGLVAPLPQSRELGRVDEGLDQGGRVMGDSMCRDRLSTTGGEKAEQGKVERAEHRGLIVVVVGRQFNRGFLPCGSPRQPCPPEKPRPP